MFIGETDLGQNRFSTAFLLLSSLNNGCKIGGLYQAFDLPRVVAFTEQPQQWLQNRWTLLIRRPVANPMYY